MIAWDWDAELTTEERDSLIEKIAHRIAKQKMETPAILFLEMHRPVSFFASQSLLLGSGFLAPLFGPDNIRRLAKLMEDRSNIDRLILKIEAETRRSREREKGDKET